MSKFVRRFLLVSSFYLLGSAATAQQLNIGAGRVESMPEDDLEVAEEAFDLASGLRQQLGITRQESAGAVASLLGYARGQLASAELDPIESIPDIQNLLREGAAGTPVTAISSRHGLHHALESTGLNRMAIEPVAVVMLDYLNAQGIGPELHSDLAAVWLNRTV
ncbi:MAG: DUF2780 domain-containing protein [Marinobacter sp.]|nr:DUF2780 domain-containing protein [Marinobacter sp.]